jgi:hypothetical protein
MIWWFRLAGDNSWGLQLKSPASPRRFSERYGYKKPLVSAFGWRLFVLRPFKGATP